MMFRNLSIPNLNKFFTCWAVDVIAALCFWEMFILNVFTILITGSCSCLFARSTRQTAAWPVIPGWKNLKLIKLWNIKISKTLIKNIVTSLFKKNINLFPFWTKLNQQCFFWTDHKSRLKFPLFILSKHEFWLKLQKLQSKTVIYDKNKPFL